MQILELKRCCDIVCFTGAHTCENSYTKTKQHLKDWKEINWFTQHNVTFCFKKQSLDVIQEKHVPRTIELLTHQTGARLVLIILPCTSSKLQVYN